MSTPRATYRLQFNHEFTFADARAVVPYIAELGASHVYASPISTARAGSMHGYDVVDPTTVSAELGGEDGLRDLAVALRDHGLGLIVDIVPNHMAADRANVWWMDVLAHGHRSRYAKYFDIDWNSTVSGLTNKVLLPILGRPYGDVLEAGEFRLVKRASGHALCYFDHVFPISENSAVADAGAFQPATPEGRQRLHALLEEQHYRLCWWRSANDLVNWRRFFDINELIAIRMEDDEVFAAVHAMPLRLYAEGIIDGFRVDHVDGLTDPQAYCRKLRGHLQALSPQRPNSRPEDYAYFVVEKILANGETLPLDWQTDGTTGYDFMDNISALLHEPDAQKKLADFWHSVSGRPPDFDVEEQLARRQILKRSFSAQFKALVDSFVAIAAATLSTRDYSAAAIGRCLTEILVNFPVYRTYQHVNERSDQDRKYLSRAIQEAMQTCLTGDRWLIPILEGWLAGIQIDQNLDALQNTALARFQQLSAPLCAKAVEDTAFYRYGPLLSRNDVGFDPRIFSCSPSEFHKNMLVRCKDYPNAMLATATHDHKRGEDVRARLAVLSEISDDWRAAADRWMKHCDGVFGQRNAMPTSGDTAMLLQMIVGAWPLNLTVSDADGLSTYQVRLAAWQQKALREAKLRSDWSEPDQAYERAAADLLSRIFSDHDILEEIYAFSERIASAGAINGLSQTLIKLTAPGVPDIYQGTEYWDFSLVDPDNRASVDFAARQNDFDRPSQSDVLLNWRNGLVKRMLVNRVLTARKQNSDLFAHGDYIPLSITGPLRDCFLAFARTDSDGSCLVIAPRLIASHISDQKTLSINSNALAATRLSLPRKLCGFYCSALSGLRMDVAADNDLASLLRHWPVGFMLRTAALNDG